MRQFCDFDRQILQEFFLLRGLPLRERTEVLADPRCVVAAYQRGDVIYSATQFDRALGLVLSGAVEVAGGPALLHYHQAGDVFGVAGLFGEVDRYVSTLTARTATRICFFPEQLLTDLFAASPCATQNYIAFLTDRVRFLNAHIEAISQPDTARLLAHFLRKQADGFPVVSLAMSVNTLARQLNTSRASLYRAFESLQVRGIIAKHGKVITILDREKLEAL